MRSILALSATKRNLVAGIARRGWKALWNVTKRTATRIYRIFFACRGEDLGEDLGEELECPVRGCPVRPLSVRSEVVRSEAVRSGEFLE